MTTISFGGTTLFCQQCCKAKQNKAATTIITTAQRVTLMRALEGCIASPWGQRCFGDEDRSPLLFSSACRQKTINIQRLPSYAHQLLLVMKRLRLQKNSFNLIIQTIYFYSYQISLHQHLSTITSPSISKQNLFLQGLK